MNQGNYKVFQERPMKLLRLTSCHLIKQICDWTMQIKWTDSNQITTRNKWQEWFLHSSFNKDMYLQVLWKQNLQLRRINSCNNLKGLNNLNNSNTLNNISSLNNQTLTSNLHLISPIKSQTASRRNSINPNPKHNHKHKTTQFNNLAHNQHTTRINTHKSNWKDLAHPLNKYWQAPLLAKVSNWMLVNSLVTLSCWIVSVNHKNQVFYKWNKDKESTVNQFKTFSYESDWYELKAD